MSTPTTPTEIHAAEARRRLDAGEVVLVEAANLAGGLGAWAQDGGALVRDDGSPGALDS